MSFLDHILTLSRRQKQALLMTADAVLIAASLALAMLFRLENWGFAANPRVWLALLPTVPATVGVFALLGLYRAMVRFVSGAALQMVLLGALASGFVMFVTAQAFGLPIPRSVPIIHAMLLFLLSGGMRILIRAAFRKPALPNRRRVIVYGAGDAGRQLLNGLTYGREYHPVAFVDDNPDLQGRTISGIPVHAPSNLPKLIRATQARSILLAIPSIGPARRREILSSLEPYGLDIKTIPGLADIVKGTANFDEIGPVKPEDLLGRDPVAPNPALMRRNIAGKVVLVSGAGGSIGSELCRQVVAQGPSDLILFESSEFALYSIDAELRETIRQLGIPLRLVPILGSVQNPGRVRAVFERFGVQTVFHAAAYKHVPLVEDNVVEGIRNNVFGTQTIARAAMAAGVDNFILISTDKAVRPTNVMGASKRMAELVCQALALEAPRTIFSMVRFGNVLGSSGSVIPLFQAQIAKGGPMTLTHREITRFFMTIPEAAQLVIQAGAMARGGDVFVLDMGEPVRILDLAISMARLHGLTPYLIEADDPLTPEAGDIAIRITGLRKGEKLYEELLIDGNPQPTEHPRILSASEIRLDRPTLDALLERLLQACQRFDLAEIRAILLEAPLAYQPNGESSGLP